MNAVWLSGLVWLNQVIDMKLKQDRFLFQVIRLELSCWGVEGWIMRPFCTYVYSNVSSLQGLYLQTGLADKASIWR